MKTSLCFINFIIVLCFPLKSQNPDIYTLYSFVNNQNDSVAFAALSDNYQLSESQDSLAIPDMSEINENEAEYLILDSIYRKRFLSKMKFSENDKVFVYDYFQHKLVSFTVKNLKVIAALNIYGAEPPYSQNVYMYGFEINRKFLNGFDTYFNHTFVSVGKKNPFEVGQLKPIAWKKIEARDFPSLPISFIPEYDSSWINKLKDPNNSYKYETDGLEYFAQDFIIDGLISARRLLVLESNTQKLVCERIFFDHEGSSPSLINYFSEPNPVIEQFTGKLFKNKPPVVFGFTYVLFGCPSIIFLNPSENDLYINCDNWH